LLKQAFRTAADEESAWPPISSQLRPTSAICVQVLSQASPPIFRSAMALATASLQPEPDVQL
jgi:hypothetical protein